MLELDEALITRAFQENAAIEALTAEIARQLALLDEARSAVARFKLLEMDLAAMYRVRALLDMPSAPDAGAADPAGRL